MPADTPKQTPLLQWQGLRILPEAMWSGTTHPLHEASFIRRYMRLRAPEAPADLIRCFDPQP